MDSSSVQNFFFFFVFVFVVVALGRRMVRPIILADPSLLIAGEADLARVEVLQQHAEGA